MATLAGTPLAHLLQSNDAPRPNQSPLVKEILRTKEAELATLAAEISKLQLALQTLQSTHADLASEINQYRSVLAPIRRLPPEIVGEVFLYFVPSLHYDFRDTTPSRRVERPWKLGHICRLWRTIALSLGQLWSVVDISATDRPPECRVRRLGAYDEQEQEEDLKNLSLPTNVYRHSEYEEGYEIETSLDFIRECVERSGKRPLSFRLNSGLRRAIVLPLFEELLKHSERWREIVLIDPPQILLHRLSHFEGRLQQLHKIVFAHFYRLDFLYHSATNLSDLTLVEVEMPPNSSVLIPWSRLTRYCEIDCQWPWANPLERVASYRQLTNLDALCLSLSSRAPFPEGTLVETRILLPNLRVASFRSRSPLCLMSDFTKFLDMPVLEAFSIHGLSTDEFDLCLPDFSPHLKILRVQINDLYKHEDHVTAERALEMFPGLTEITLDAPNLITDHVVSRLTPRPDQPPLCPQLEIIRFANKSFINNDCKWTTLLEMLHARFKPTVEGVSRLHSFELHADERANDKTVAAGLKALKVQTRWDIRVGEWCKTPDWDDLHLQPST
ncbi:hypothetical protein C8R44DRAFT_2061 [Mycena epipterygia]|nr:hypothetical protein C8R44DRAFT_2061 [Mycena epipterygia]